jgi:hypothetical protein
MERASPLSDGLMTSRISTSLCRVIFKSTEIHDATSLMTLLQADLRVLKELGFPGASATSFCLPQVADLFVIHQPVDRVLRQKAEREAAERADASPQPTPPSKSIDSSVPPPELSPIPGPPSITPLIDIGTAIID